MRNNIILGIILSVGITIMLTLPRLTTGRGAEYIDAVAINTFIMLIATWFGHLWLLTCSRYKQLIPKPRLRNVLSIMAITVVVYFLLELISPLIDTPDGSWLFEKVENRVEKWSFWRVFVWNIIYHLILFSQMIIMEKKSAELKASNAERLALEAKLTSLGEQLSPHFMFNSLNTISSMTDDVAVQNFVERLAGVYRYLLANRNQKSVSLKAELDFALHYWYIQKERFSAAIDLTVDINSDLESIQIAPMTLQTLLENAIKHNKATVRTPLNVSIVESEEHLIVSNRVEPKRVVAESTGIGLHNLTERYRLLFNKEVIITQNGYFIVKLPIVRV